MARDIDLLDLFEDDGIDEAALVRVASRFDPKDYDDLSNPSVMQTFYRRLFPAKQLFTWLNHDHVPTKQWTHREIAFTLANDAYLRYNSFASHVDFHREVIRLNPARFEIGAIYNAKPKDKRLQLKQALKPVQRELVFDIDMTDYDEIRTCCQGKGICTRCWKFIACAVKVLNRALREDFGFQHLMWVYSGRRGIHCWISDASALNLSDEQRKGIVGYLEVIKGGAAQHKKVELVRPLHPFIRTCMEQLKEPFHQIILDDQDCFRSQAGWQALLQLIPTNEEKLVQLRDSLQNEWQNRAAMSSRDRWQTLIERGRDKISEERVEQRRRNAGEKLQAALDDIKMQYLYARIDAEVSKHQNHLLKSPFVVHPGTGRVCVPVDPERVDEFDPEKVPTVGLLLRELDKAALQGNKDSDGSTIEPTWEHTSLKPYVDMFDRHIAAIVKESIRSRRAAKAETFEF